MATLPRRPVLLGLVATLSLLVSLAPQPVFAATSRSDISVTISASRHTVGIGQKITYVATMTNRGPNDAAFVDVVFSWTGKLGAGSLTCAHGISADGAACEYSTLKAGETVISVLPASALQGARRGDRWTVKASVLFEVDCSFDPNCTFDPNLRNNTASVTTRVR